MEEKHKLGFLEEDNDSTPAKRVESFNSSSSSPSQLSSSAPQPMPAKNSDEKGVKYLWVEGLVAFGVTLACVGQLIDMGAPRAISTHVIGPFVFFGSMVFLLFVFPGRLRD